MKEYLKNEIKHIPFVFVVLVLLYCVTTYATNSTVTANQVSYNAQGTGLTSHNVQSAIDEVYRHTTDYNNMDNRVTAAETLIGNTALTTTAQTLTAAINELNTTASTSGYGKTMLSSSLTSDSQSLAATPYAVKQLKDTLDAMPIDTLKYTSLSVTASTSKTFNVVTGWHLLVVVSGAGTPYAGVFMIHCQSNGTISNTAIFQGSGISVSTAKNAITIGGTHASSTTAVVIYDICIYGSVLTEAS